MVIKEGEAEGAKKRSRNGGENMKKRSGEKRVKVQRAIY